MGKYEPQVSGGLPFLRINNIFVAYTVEEDSLVLESVGIFSLESPLMSFETFYITLGRTHLAQELLHTIRNLLPL